MAVGGHIELSPTSAGLLLTQRWSVSAALAESPASIVSCQQWAVVVLNGFVVAAWSSLVDEMASAPACWRHNNTSNNSTNNDHCYIRRLL